MRSTTASKPATSGKLPKGWSVYQGDGYTVPVPAGASVRSSGSEVYFTANNRLLIVDQTDQPKADPVADKRRRDHQPLAPYRIRLSASVILRSGASKSLPAFHFSKAMTFSMRASTNAAAASRPDDRRMASALARMPERIARLD